VKQKYSKAETKTFSWFFIQHSIDTESIEIFKKLYHYGRYCKTILCKSSNDWP